ncbi:MAG TPA: Uma2 family endonuclease [Pirellulaceae bacterium]|nr:Uma2 family endonuclease [Pirellulaceae bacterium]
MSTAVLSTPKLLTAEEYLLLPDNVDRRELRRGVVVVMNPPGFRHGEVCGNIHFYLASFVREHQLGRALTNDSGIITERDPDTVRGADISFYSYKRVPKGQSPLGYAGASPEIVFEVVSPYNTRKDIASKTGEYLQAGINVVCVVDAQHGTVELHYPDQPSATLRGNDPLTFAELNGFSLPVRKLFE